MPFSGRLHACKYWCTTYHHEVEEELTIDRIKEERSCIMKIWLLLTMNWKPVWICQIISTTYFASMSPSQNHQREEVAYVAAPSDESHNSKQRCQWSILTIAKKTGEYSDHQCVCEKSPINYYLEISGDIVIVSILILLVVCEVRDIFAVGGVTIISCMQVWMRTKGIIPVTEDNESPKWKEY